MLNLSKYCYDDLQHSMTYWLRSAGNNNRAIDVPAETRGGYFKFCCFNKYYQLFDNHLQCGYVTRYGHLYASSDVRYKFEFSPICKI